MVFIFKKHKRRLCYAVMLISFLVSCLQASISFSDRNGSVRLNNGSTLFVGSAINNWDGTLEKKDGASINGDIIIFQNGILESGGTDALLNAMYQGGGLETLFLTGSSRIRAEPGLLIPQVLVSGGNNSIEGQPRFSGDISLDGDSNTSLILALQSAMNKNINVNYGSIILNDDLHFADDANFQGEGLVDLNFKSLHFSPYDLIATHSLLFHNATDINLHSRVNLSSTYIFDGETFVNGHGNVLDLSAGGRLVVRPQSKVYLSDVYLRGFGYGGQIIFSDNTSSLHLSNVHIELDDNMRMTIGSISVEGDSVFILKHWDWTFDIHATLTVNGATLWLDVDNPQSGNLPGLLNIPNPLYLDHIWNLTNEMEGRHLGNFSLIQTGTVKELGWSMTQTGTDVTCILVRAPLFSDVSMLRNCDVPPVKKIDIRESITIDGQGAWISFSNSGSPEFVVAPGKTVRLKNVNLLRITSTTFSLGEGASLEIDKSVVFELIEDLSLTGDYIKVLGTDTDPNIFIIRGVGSQKRVTIDPIYQQTLSGSNIIKTFDMGLATVVLENVEFSGLQSVNVNRVQMPGGGDFVGAFGLFDNATVDIDVDSSMSFYTEGASGLLNMLSTGLTLSGFILFSPQFDSTLHMKFNLLQKINTAPTVNLADNAIYLTSATGRARMVFDDYSVVLNLLGSNSFITDVHSFIGGQKISVLQFPIKQQSVDLTLDGALRLTSNQPNAIDTSFVRSISGRLHPVQMAITQLRLKKQRACDKRRVLKQARQEKLPIVMPTLKKTPLSKKEVEKKAGIVLAKNNKKPKTEKKTKENKTILHRDVDILDTDELTRLGPVGETPEPYIVYEKSNSPSDVFGNIGGDAQRQLTKAAGKIGVQDGTVTDFGIDTNNVLTLWMLGNAKLLQGVDATWKLDDKLYVHGENNVIRVTNTMQFTGNIIFDVGARLTFEFDESANNPTVIFDSSVYKTLFLSPLVQLEFKGTGTVLFTNGKCITFTGTQDTEQALITITDDAAMKLGSGVAGNDTVIISGYGDVAIENGASLFVKRGQHLIFGDAITDNIGFIVNRSGIVDIGDSLEDGVTSVSKDLARISFIKTTYSISFAQGGILNIGKGGVFAVNAKSDVAYDKQYAGLLQTLNLGDGSLFWLDHDGRFVIGQNKADAKTGQISQITFNSKYGSMQGDGVVELAGTSLIGRPCFWTAARMLYDAQHLVRLFINRKKQLNFSTFFVAEDGKAWLFNKDVDLYKLGFPTPTSTIFMLFTDDEIRNDDKTTGYVYGVNNGQMFAILPDGTRT